uniref:Uncharacterized protein n=1 Tax=Branchiostoma floridae TaxID=7739 RepID=C3YGS5_BRAFL|eukprot:XP_002604574.1 hypothetical protein BRAFLDRAFT_122353 [Branchiostoma floridae]
MNQPTVETNRPGDRSPTAKDKNTLPRGSPDAKGAFIPVSNSSTPSRGQMLAVSVNTQVNDGPKGRGVFSGSLTNTSSQKNIYSIQELLSNQDMTIHQLAAQGEVALLSIRHDEGYDMNEVDENGLTSLMWASSHGQVGVTVFLLENGGSVHGATREGETALSFACCKGHVEIVQALLKAGADVNAFDWVRLMPSLLNQNTALT